MQASLTAFGKNAARAHGDAEEKPGFVLRQDDAPRNRGSADETSKPPARGSRAKTAQDHEPSRDQTLNMEKTPREAQ